MVAVKGSKPYHYKVVRSSSPALRWLYAGAVVVLIAVIYLAFHFGMQWGLQEQERSTGEIKSLRSDLREARNNLTVLRQDLENARLGNELDGKVLEDVRLQVTDLRTQIADLEEENQFYRNLMAPSENRRGLTFGTVEIGYVDQTRTYRYKVVLQQLATNHDLLNGTLDFNIVGRQNGELVVLPLSSVSDDVDSNNIKLRFRYFQNVEGTLVLPEGFEPARIDLEARSTTPRTSTVEKRLEWLVQSN